jgi:acyl carrier protein
MIDDLEIVRETLRALAIDRVIPRDILETRLEGTTRLEDLAIDSIGKLAVLNELEARSGVLLDERRLADCATLGDLAACIGRSRG